MEPADLPSPHTLMNQENFNVFKNLKAAFEMRLYESCRVQQIQHCVGDRKCPTLGRISSSRIDELAHLM